MCVALVTCTHLPSDLGSFCLAFVFVGFFPGLFWLQALHTHPAFEADILYFSRVHPCEVWAFRGVGTVVPIE